VSAAGRARVKQRIQARAARRSYQTVAIGLYEDQTRAIDHAVQGLQEAGYLKANRSLIFQTLAKRFLEEIDGLNQEEMLEYLLRTHFRRPLARATRPDAGSTRERKAAARSDNRVRAPGSRAS
jgi:hypothetical protein